MEEPLLSEKASGGGGGARVAPADQPTPARPSPRLPKRGKSSTRMVQTESAALLQRASAGLVGGGATSAGMELLKSIQEMEPPSMKEAEPKAEMEAIKQPETERKRVGLFALFRYSTTRERWLMAAGMVSATIAGLSMPVWLLLLAQSLQTFNEIGTIIAAGGSITILLDEMYKLIYSFAIVGGVSLFSGAAYVSTWTYVGEAQTLRIRKAFVKSALTQEMAWFDTSVGDPQELPVMAANALGRIQISLGRAGADTFANLLSAVGCLLVSLGLDAPLAILMLCALPVVGIAIGVVSCFMRKYSGLALESFAAAGAFASEVLTGIKTVSSLRAESWAVQRYTETVTEAQGHGVRSVAYSRLASGIMGLMFYVTYTFAFMIGTYQASQRAEVEASFISPFACWFRTDCGIHGSEVMVCIYGIILTAQFLALMNPGIQALNLGRIAAADIYSAIERDPVIDGTDDIRGEKLGDEYDGGIELRNIIFAYPSRPRDIIFRDLSLKIEPGMAVALVGPSGSGKSSLSKLLLRLYDPIGGEISVGTGGASLTEINLKWWREQIGYVSQEPSLFPGSVRDNIAAGKVGGDDATDAEVEAAARAASAHEFIADLPDGYDTFYSGSSIQLSGGQIQRISIARALIRNPKILLLDEATSALDTASERVVQDALEKIRQERKLTTITVAHRLSTIVTSDKIVVVADGSIQEAGTHRELVNLGGIYATLCEGQGLTADAGDYADAVPAFEAALQSDKASLARSAASGADVETALIVDDTVGEAAGEEDKEYTPDMKGVRARLFQYSKGDTMYSVLGYIGGVIVGALPAGEAILFGQITGNFFIISDAEQMRQTNYALSWWFLLLAALSFLGNIFMGIGFGVSGSRLTKRMRVLVFDKLMRMPMGWFDYPEHSTGELTTMLEEDSELVSNVTGLSQGQRVQVFSCLAAGLLVTMIYSWQVGLCAIACVPLILGSSIIQSRYASREPSNDNLISPATLLERSFADIVLLQAYGMQDDVSRKYSIALEPDIQFKKKQAGYSGLAFGLSQFAVFGTFALVFFVGIKLMIGGQLSFTDFFVALLAVMFSSFGAGQSGADFSAQRKGFEAAARLFEISDDAIDDEDNPLSEKGSRPEINGKVCFKSCEFAYPTRPATKIYYKKGDRDGFSLDIDSRQSIAFTGKSGCGKSTALQLLLRFYRVSSGVVEVDGENVSEVNIGHLRDSIGYVGQMPVLFDGTIRDNILLGKPNATQEEIEAAAKSANAHNFILSLSAKYDTEIGVGGGLLSGGQRQRVAIARAIIKNPKILVLDEATAALDNESEKIVQAALDKMQETNPRTTLTVAHRLETVKNCDKIVVIDDGGVKEAGTHSDLLNLRGLYHTLWTKQSGGQS